jgi:hypothetical protein
MGTPASGSASEASPASEVPVPEGVAAPPPSTPAPRLMATAPSRATVVTPLAPERYKIQFTVTRDVHDKLRQAQDLLRHGIPDGDVAAIFEKALTLLLEHTAKRKCAATARPRAAAPPRARTRYIPAAVRRVVWSRDAAQCAFMGTDGRCTERSGLEFHHVHPFAAGGESSSSANIDLRCRRHHNLYETELCFAVDHEPEEDG